MKKAIAIPNAPAPIGPYSPAVVKGNMLFVSGQIPLNPANGDIEREDIKKATKQVMENVKALVEEAGFAMSDVMKCTIFLTSMADFTDVNEVYGTFFTSEPPARETVAVKELPREVRVEISCIAMK
ncbi:MAG TPA: RidA family protein [Brumimicrobium sp.]|nr:RidA family protein [Brumimicrobium sp.]